MSDSNNTAEPSVEAPEAAVDEPVAGAPSDNTTLVGVLTAWEERGFGAQLIATDGARIQCVECGTVSPASEFRVVETRRLEGASDPDDMVHGIAANCPVCGAGGSLVIGYGASASDADVDVAHALKGLSDAPVQTPSADRASH